MGQDTVDVKKCKECGEVKPLKDFYKHKLTLDNRQGKCKVCTKKITKSWNSKNPVSGQRSTWKHHLHIKYGMTVKMFDDMLVSQSGLCYICSTPMEDPQVDHCHKTGKVRKALCRSCNIGLGNFKDNPEVLRLAASYVEEMNE